MVRAVRKTVTVQPGGRVEVASDELPEGAPEEVIILVDQDQRHKSYTSYFGSGKGAYDSPESADAFLREERNSWER